MVAWVVVVVVEVGGGWMVVGGGKLKSDFWLDRQQFNTPLY